MGFSNQADVESDMIKARYCIYHVKFTSYCELIECSRPLSFFIVSLMYKNNLYTGVGIQYFLGSHVASIT